MRIDKIFILTLKRQWWRRAFQVGALDVMGYPLSDLLEFVEGTDYDLYGNESWIQDAVNDGFSFFSEYEHHHYIDYMGCMIWGQMRILRNILENNLTALVIEDDVLITLPYKELRFKLDMLHKNASPLPQCIMLSYRSGDGVRNRPFVPNTNGLWVQGSRNSGHLINVYTPAFAKRIFDYYNNVLAQNTIENLLASEYEDEPWLYSSYEDYGLSMQCGGAGVTAYWHQKDGREYPEDTTPSLLRRWGLSEN